MASIVSNRPTDGRKFAISLYWVVAFVVLAAIAGVGAVRWLQKDDAAGCAQWSTVAPDNVRNIRGEARCNLDRIFAENPPPAPSRAPTRPRPTTEPLPINSEFEAIFQRALQDVEIAVKVPSTLGREQPGEVVAVIRTRDNQDIDSFFGQPGSAPAAKRIRVLPVVQLVLRGSDFDVAPADPEWRTLTRHVPSSWLWTVRSARAGSKSLVIAVRGRLMIDAIEHVVDLYQQRVTIDVTSGPVERVTQMVGTWTNLLDLVERIWAASAAGAGFILAMIIRRFRVLKRGRQKRAAAR